MANGDFSKPDMEDASWDDQGEGDFMEQIRNLVDSLVKWLDGTEDTNIPDDAKRLSTANRRPEIYDVTSETWDELFDIDDPDEAYNIRVAVANSADEVPSTGTVHPDAVNRGGTVGRATAAEGIVRSDETVVLADHIVDDLDPALSDARGWNGNIDSALLVTARSNLGVTSTADLTAALNLKANLASPALVTPTRTTTPATDDDSHALADTAFVQNNVSALSTLISGKLSIGSWVDLSAYVNSGGDWFIDGAGHGALRAVPITSNGSVVCMFLDLKLSALLGGTDTTLCTLPSAYRTTYRSKHYGNVYCSGAIDIDQNYLTINTDGTIEITSRSASYYYWVTFQGFVWFS